MIRLFCYYTISCLHDRYKSLILGLAASVKFLASIGIIMIFRSLLLLTMSLTPVAELQGRLPARRVGASEIAVRWDFHRFETACR